MMKPSEKESILRLIHEEVVPAIGCTEPIAVSLAVAKATELLGTVPEKIQLYLSANVLKNAMGVGIPGTGMFGLPIAIALGALIGKSEYQLEVLKDMTPEAVEQGRAMIAAKAIHIALKEELEEKLYIEAIVSAGTDTAIAIIRKEHTHFTYWEKNGTVLLDEKQEAEAGSENAGPELNLLKVFRFAMDTPVDEIRFILESARLNKAAAREALNQNMGHALGRTLLCYPDPKIMGDSMLSRIISYTSAACDARMAGSMVPVMTNSGSGNQGITATLPVVTYAEEVNASEEQLIRALMLSHLTVIYIKQSLGRLSALCGCVVASTGSACGITYLMGGDYQHITYAVKNMVANLAGIICDGAKPSCALKVSSSVSTAVFSAMMAMENKYVTSVEGIIDEDVDQSIRNLTRIGSDAMNETDRVILEIMTNK